VTGFTNIEAFQTGIFIDQAKLEVLDVFSGHLSEFDLQENVGLEQLEQNQFNALWLKSTPQSETLTGSNNILFTLKVKALQSVSDLSEAISISKEKAALPTMFFSNSSEGCAGGVSLSLEVEPLQGARGVKSRDLEGGARAPWATLYCYPNPARNAASVSFEASFDGVGTLSVFDVHGKRMFAQPIEIRSGSNLAELPSERFDLLPPGVYQVALHTKEGAKTGLLVKI
jgi:hypothetical protein